eukprot:evm.model.scf_1643.4 EVM.evm.TU.scf_1643.4   scf_1643:13255-13719(-)
MERLSLNIAGPIVSMLLASLACLAQAHFVQNATLEVLQTGNEGFLLGGNVELVSYIQYKDFPETMVTSRLAENTEWLPPLQIHNASIGEVASPKNVHFDVIEHDGIFPSDDILEVSMNVSLCDCDGRTVSEIHTRDSDGKQWKLRCNSTCIFVS